MMALRSVLLGGSLVLALAIAGTASRYGVERGLRFLRGDGTPPPTSRLAALRSNHREVAFVFLTSSRCSAATDKDLPWQLDSLRALVERQALGRGWGYTSIAIAIDLIPSEGLIHLRRFSGFDEITSGRASLSTAAQHYFSQDLRGLVATPSVLVLVREVVGQNDYVVRNERALVRITGLIEMRRWLASGALVPLDAERVGERSTPGRTKRAQGMRATTQLP